MNSYTLLQSFDPVILNSSFAQHECCWSFVLIELVNQKFGSFQKWFKKLKYFPTHDLSLRPSACQASILSISPNGLVRVKGVKVCAQPSMSKHCQLAVGSEFCEFGKKVSLYNQFYLTKKLPANFDRFAWCSWWKIKIKTDSFCSPIIGISVADLNTKLSGAHPLRGPILSFLYTFSLKSAYVGGPCPSNGSTLPMGNPGSATVFIPI